MTIIRALSLPRSAVIVGYARTPIGSFLGRLSSFKAPQLGAHAITRALAQAKVDVGEVDQVIMGHVLSAACGQAPARQAALAAKLPSSTNVMSVNKVCSSGMKAVSMAAASIAIGEADVIVAGGMESMSNTPHALTEARSGGYKYGHGQLVDLVLRDGLWDVYNDIHMGKCAEKTVKEFGITREEQDDYAIQSYQRAAAAWSRGKMKNEAFPVEVPSTVKGGEPKIFYSDEEFTNLKIERVAAVRPAFLKDGTITAANASKLNDGAAALVVVSEEFSREQGLTPLARIISWADFEQDPIDYSLSPAGAARVALQRAGMTTKDVDVWEINEAFSSVAIANMRLLELDPSRVNVDGGAVALGHPIGASGARLVGTLSRILGHHSHNTSTATSQLQGEVSHMRATLTLAKESRKRSELDAQLLANRIALLKQEEEKAWKKIQETRRKAEQINTLRAENEAKMLAREEMHKKQRQATEAIQVRNASLKDKSRQQREASKSAVLETKRYLVREGREEQMKLQRQRQEEWMRDRGLNTTRVTAIRNQKENARKKIEEEKLRKLENSRIEYENKVQQEEAIRSRTESLVSAMEREEMELIQRLQNTQNIQRSAYQELENALGKSSRSPLATSSTFVRDSSKGGIREASAPSTAVSPPAPQGQDSTA
ncbi:conserved hypothetical protein [Perkinsus marinus ATCC 50983]|uniref:Acetyl-CoA acetyltransferase n=1 Tax=Perkinsus marinus (strain ATCC 50983 / TXsc) TaxID=423536 RepID=C5LZR9_PERM5|nr:conserved hypothetical protein [Perkinsus marinus ATCC 50983]EEQ97737.1 conserved hypothetical protein [Perkinsus marinus ATCC 50983]|eukprot:XP_002765020.1 conserved hypothetical protein [Perkinsus marinus ATCC 50983]